MNQIQSLYATSRPTVIRTLKEYRNLRKQWQSSNQRVGFVPTMGALHEGHLKLAHQAKSTCDKVVVSVFVNPSQFAPHEDLAKYPRTENLDLELLAKENVDVVFIPSVEELYPSGITLDVSKQTGAFVNVHGLSHQMEGAIRTHFFRGVATVVSKLFNATQPNVAFFGQKDVQQCVVIKNMVKDLLMPIDIEIVGTMRESDGLAMSSRNRYLSEIERKKAPMLYESLQIIQNAYSKQMVYDRKKLIKLATEHISKDPSVKLEYLSISDPKTLSELSKVSGPAIVSGAMKVGNTRIIDNLLLGMTIDDLGYREFS